MALDFADQAAALADPFVWEKIQQKLATGAMPPKGMPRPDKASVEAVIQWATEQVERAQAAIQPDPGRVTVRRLNRAEYNNTVRDLLGIDIRPADEFPVDDTGYGFDNIGDVLTVSPVLMEKYLAAATKIARKAIVNERTVKPTVLGISAPRSDSDDPQIGSTVESPYSPEGRLQAVYEFPATGEYNVKLSYVDRRNVPERRPEWMSRIPEVIEKITAAHAEEIAIAEVRQALGYDRGDAYSLLRALNATRKGEDYVIAKQLMLDRLAEKALWVAENPEPPGPPPPPALPVTFSIGGEKVAEYLADKDPSTPGPNTIRMRIEAGEKEIFAEILSTEGKPWNPNSLDWNEYRAATTQTADRMVFVDGVEIEGPYDAEPAPLPESHRRIMLCAPAEGQWDASCAERILGRLTKLAFRRPVSRDEVARYTRFAKMAVDDGDSFEQGVQLAVKALLVSPEFLFRIENDAQPTDPEAIHPVGDYELASRISYFLWSSMPDEALLTAAGKGELRKPELLRAQVERMLRDPRSEAFTKNFAGQWLELRNLAIARPDPEIFPEFDESLRRAMVRETELFFYHIVRNNESLLDFLTADYTFVNERLAKHYGLEGVKGSKFRKVDVPADRRGGVLGHASVLTVSSYPTRTSPVLRGLWVLEKLLGVPPPDPPANVPQLNTEVVGKASSLREELERHRLDPNCAVCHERMDPLGFGLENYNAIGAWRDKDGGIPIDPSGQLPDGRSFQGPADLRNMLYADGDKFIHALTEKMLTYALGRGLERYDRAAVDKIRGQLADDGYRFSSLAMGIIESLPFQMRRGEGGT